MNSIRNSIVLGFALFTASTSFANAPVHTMLCPDAFRSVFVTLKPHIGTPVVDKRFPNADASFLGQGFGGGDVFLIRPHDKSAPYVVKDFNLGGSDSMINDLQGLAILEVITAERQTQKSMRPVKVIDRLEDDLLKLEYIPGRDLHKVGVETTDPEAHSKLARLFDRQIETLKSHLPIGTVITTSAAHYTVLDASIQRSKSPGFHDLVVVLRRDYPKDTVHLWIKPENVVLTEDGQLVIIDPR